MTDAELLDHIAKERSQTAFTELYQRYASAAYSLAFSLTNNRSLAEEAVQNALLRIWLSASKFQPGNARGWILCIVAREGLKLIKVQQREQRKVMDFEYTDDRHAETAASELPERREMLAALRGAIQALPVLDRQLVTLYYVGGLSQDEIARELNTPRQTVSRHIKDAIEYLRGNLARAGFAAAMPLVSAEALSEITCSGCTAPTGLRERVLSKLSSPQTGTKTFSRRTVRRAMPGHSGMLAASVVGGAAAVVMVAVWAGGPKQGTGNSVAAAPVPIPQPSAPAVLAPKPVVASKPIAKPPAETAKALPAWQPVTDDFHEVLGKAGGVWKAEHGRDGLILTFAPAAGQEGIVPSYCYLGHNLHSSYEMQGLLECTGAANECGLLFLICHPNRTNCTGYACRFPSTAAPLRFRMQVRIDANGCRFALSVIDATGQKHASQSSGEWIQPPWNDLSKEQLASVSNWKQLAFAQMRECGFGFEALFPMRFSKLQVRPLADSEWCAGPEASAGQQP